MILYDTLRYGKLCITVKFESSIKLYMKYLLLLAFIGSCSYNYGQCSLSKVHYVILPFKLHFIELTALKNLSNKMETF